MKIFVTGASGFVGLSLTKDLVKKQYQVYGLIRRDEAAKQLNDMGVTPIKGDLLKPGQFRNRLNGIDVFIHLAALVKFSGDFDQYYKLNVESTKQLIDFAIKEAIKKFIYISAAAIALDGSDLLDISEDYNPMKRIDSNYLKSKSQAEQVILQRKNEIQTIILRPPVIWGSGMRIMEEFRPTIQKMGFPVIGDINHHIATCHVKNLNAAILQSVVSQTTQGIFLVGDGEKVKVKNFMYELIKGYGMNMGNIHIPKKLALIIASFLEYLWKVFGFNSDPPMTTMIVHLMGTEFTIDDSKIRRELGYKNVIRVEEGLRSLNN